VSADVPLRRDLAFAEAYRRLIPLARRTAGAILRDDAAAEDVAQEVFVSLWERPQLYDPRRGSLDVLVRVMARTRAMDARRRRALAARTVGERLVHQLPSPADDPLETATRRARSRDLLSALDALRPEQRTAVLGNHVAGYTARELSAAASVPLGTMKSRIRTGLRRLESAAA
jgi:RNA polymerase sigma-70 factor, ECF subfamily